jgi:mRNA-degrading endonuclease RelE of RelBE toxin-antitoxin system
MPNFRIFITESFEKEFAKLSKQEQKRIEKAKEQLKLNPFVGKPLGYTFFREKKIGNKRLYYLIYEEKVIVLLVAYGGKKNQQAIINAIKASFQEFKEEIEKASLKPIP